MRTQVLRPHRAATLGCFRHRACQRSVLTKSAFASALPEKVIARRGASGLRQGVAPCGNLQQPSCRHALRFAAAPRWCLETSTHRRLEPDLATHRFAGTCGRKMIAIRWSDRATLGTPWRHVACAVPPMTSRSPQPSWKAQLRAPVFARMTKRLGAPVEIVAMIVLVLAYPIRSPCMATLSAPSRYQASATDVSGNL